MKMADSFHSVTLLLSQGQALRKQESRSLGGGYLLPVFMGTSFAGMTKGICMVKAGEYSHGNE